MMARFAKAYQSNDVSLVFKVVIFICGVLGIMIAARKLFPARSMFPSASVSSSSSSVFHYLSPLPQHGRRIVATTWNIAAINNNPFEYWITNEDAIYNDLMKKVSLFIETPGAYDIPVKEVFTEQMFTDLESSMKLVEWTGVAETRSMWDEDFKNRKIITGFIKDGLLGKKRLASMPDRVTNSINTVNEGVVTRPSVINCYSGDLGSIDKWWDQWREFIFSKNVLIKKHGVDTSVKIMDLITPISKSKYPAITTEEEKISVPLQVLCAAIFDAILVDMMNKLAPSQWQPLREDMCNKLNRHKLDRTMEILETTYANSDIQFLQEVSSSFSESATNPSRKLGHLFEVWSPASMDADRDQNSYILLKREKFRDVKEVTEEVLAEFSSSSSSSSNSKIPVMKGDLLVLTAVDSSSGSKFLLASFHGDTNGLATIPVVTAVYNYAMSKRPDHKLLFGMDANTYEKPDEDQQGVVAFAKFYTSKKLDSCYGPEPNPKNYTTFHARTHLQPQLNKAVSLEEKGIKGDKNPKDFIIFFAADFQVLVTTKDNTGHRKYVDDMVFPTLTFPSDHGITYTELLEVNNNSKGAASLRGVV